MLHVLTQPSQDTKIAVKILVPVFDKLHNGLYLDDQPQLPQISPLCRSEMYECTHKSITKPICD